MSLLSDVEILDEIKKGELRIEPFDRKMLGPDSIDIKLSGELLVAKKVGRVLDPAKKENEFFEKVKIPDEGFVLKCGMFVLGSTEEKIGLSDSIAAQIEGRSSIGRYGIVVHMTAGIIHAGFGAKTPSTLTLEISSVNPNDVLLRKGMKIAQLSFFKLNRKASTGYDFKEGSKYVSQTAPQAPKVYMD
ncbi:dCTP deaminase, dUMP-forming [Candidatus Gugararchaeum adminiculabundum]|nr:dCTP deaminase, dUMP-forming [Candidatus Gugararchaeum adminiculabundum]